MAGSRFDVEPSARALMQDLGLSPARVLRRAGLPSDLFDSGRAVELGVQDYYRVWTAMDAEADSRDLALDMARAFSVEHFSAPMLAALYSEHLAAAARRLAEHKPLVGPVRIAVSEQAPGRAAEGPASLAILCKWPTSAPPPPLLGVVELLFWVVLARIGTRAQIRPASIAMPSGTRDVGRLEEFLGVRVSIEDSYRISFSSADARRPFLTENGQLWEALAPGFRRRMGLLAASTSVTDQVRAVLHENLQAGDPSIGSVLQRLGTSSRTLQRQLSREGTSFNAVLASIRAELAEHFLRTQGMRTSDVAFLLGYNDISSFYRAFRRWTGSTPESVRDFGT